MSFKKKEWIENALRRASYKYPPRNTAKTLARVERGKYRCAACSQIHRAKDVQMDHIIPVIDPVRGFTDWNDYIERCFPGLEGWQVLCKPCHALKSNSENIVRRKRK